MYRVSRVLLIFLSLEAASFGILQLLRFTQHVSFGLNYSLSTSASPAIGGVSSKPELSSIHGIPPDNFRVQWHGHWYVPDTGIYRISAGADDEVQVKLDDRLVITRNLQVGFREISRLIPFRKGLHAIQVDYRQNGGDYFLNVDLGSAEPYLRPFDFTSYFIQKTGRSTLFAIQLARQFAIWLGTLAWAAPLLFSGILVSAAFRHFQPSALNWNAILKGARILIPVLIILYAAALRFEALIIKHGPLKQPDWFYAFQEKAVPFIARLHPRALRWQSGANPYEKGDPINYLRMARAMKSFYAAQFREPFYVYVTKVSLKVFGSQDVAVSFGSALFSVLSVWMTYVLGTFAFSWGVGTLAAFLLAVEQEAISLGADGWRDDTFMFLVLLSAYCLLRLMRASTFTNALLAGASCAAVCLTRLTSFSFIVPAFLLVVFFSWEPSVRKRLEHIGLSIFFLLIFIAPFLINCAIVYGDPLFSINDNTKFYRARENLSANTDLPVSDYLFTKWKDRPWKFADTGITGLTAYPFLNKWKGFEYWIPDSGWWLSAFAMIGMILFLFSSTGRLLFLITLTSLIPYAFTWQIPGGSEWRFTLHSYPFFVIAASLVIVTILSAIVKRESGWASIFDSRPPRFAPVVVPVVVTAGLLGLWLLLNQLNYFRKQEAIRAGDPILISAGDRDLQFFGNGWFHPVKTDQKEGRINKSPEMFLRIPLARAEQYLLLIGIEPIFDEVRFLKHMEIFANDRLVGNLPAEAMMATAAKKVVLPSSVLHEGRNVFRLQAIYSASQDSFADPLLLTYIKIQTSDLYASGLEKYEKGDWEGAISDLQGALNSGKRRGATFYFLGMCYFKKANYREAVTNFTEGLSVSRGNSIILLARGECYFKMGDPQSAIRDLQKVLKQKPDNVEAHYYIALAYQRLGNTNEAKAHLRILTKLAPSHPYVLDLKRLLSQ